MPIYIMDTHNEYMFELFLHRITKIENAGSVHRTSAGYAPELTARVAMALSKLSGDEQGIILGQLRNTLEPRLVMYFSTAPAKSCGRC